MKTAFYTKIDLYDGLTEADVIKRAHVLGYELMKFAGYSDADLGMPGNHGPRWADAQRNKTALKTISGSLVKTYPDNTYDAIVFHCGPGDDAGTCCMM